MRRSLVSFLAIVALVGCGDDGMDMPPPGGDAGVDAGDPGGGETFCAALPPVSSGTCEVTAGSEAKLIRGNILTPQTVFVGGQVLVDSAGTIACVGCDCGQGGETVISCPGASVSPGLINTHDHITFAQNPPYTPPTVNNVPVRYEHRHQWRKGDLANGKPKIPAAGGASAVRISWGELRFVLGGATSIVGSGGQAGLARNLDIATLQEGLNQPAVKFETFPLGDSSGTMLESTCDYGGTITAAEVAALEAFEPHTSEGVNEAAHNEFRCQSSSTYDVTGAPQVSQNLLLPQTAMIHAIGLSTADYGLMAVARTGLVWSPRSNITLYGDTARVTTAAAFGVEIALGTDWMPTGSMNLLRELRCADELNARNFGGYFTDKQLWEMVTVNAASVTATDDVIGVLAPGRVADIAIFASGGRAHHRAVIEAEPKDLALVMRGGRVLYGDDATVSNLTTSCDTVDVCGVAKRVCVKRELGKTWDELVAAVGDVYPAFACGVPANEPSCTPFRPAAVNGSTVFTQGITAGDSDGDGIADGVDSCPTVFNPVRPMDGMQQPDADGDGDGDACGPCPTDAGTTTCTAVNPNDRDGDGIVNASDNCPDASNGSQSDGDGDGKGDACDPCPADANPGAAGCPTTIYKIKQGVTPVGATVRVDNALVTGKGSNGFFVQVKAGDAAYQGVDHSGIFVYAPPMSPQLAAAVVGMRVSIDAAVGVYQGQVQLDSVSSVFPTTMVAEAAPAAEPVTFAQVKTGGARAAALESVLVALPEATVTALNAQFGEYTLTSGADALFVDDFLYAMTPPASVGMAVSSITGILASRQMASKLEPRGPGDVVLGAPTLASFGPALSYVRAGQSGASTFPAGSELTVTLSGPAQGDTFVTIGASSAALTVAGGGVTVPSGQTSAQVVVSGVQQSVDVTLTAQLGAGSPLTAHVRVLGLTEAPTQVTLSPVSATVAPGGSVQLTVTLDIPAPAGGASVGLSVSPSGAGTTNPASSVVVAQDTLSATVAYTDVAGSGTATVSAALTGGNTSTASILVAQGASHLVINEVDYDQINTDSAEYIEIYNPTSAAVSLSNVAVVLINGSTNLAYPTSTSTIDLSTLGMLPAGGYLVIAGPNITVPAGALKLDPGWTSDQLQNGSPDGIALVDTNAGTLIDALSYEGSVTMADVPGVASPVSLVEGTALSGTVVDLNTAAGALCRTPNGRDTDNANADWVFCATLTPGAANP